MKKPDTTIIDQEWPAEDLEEVHSCPYCSSEKRTIAYQNVQDWSFYCAPGKWTYWDCSECKSLYLNPRPTVQSIGKAYASYYTHGLKNQSKLHKFLNRLKNEIYSKKLNVEVIPRLGVPKQFDFLFSLFEDVVNVPYEFGFFSKAIKGTLLDVGCGSGETLKFAKQLGFNVTGLEVDLSAVAAARSLGLNIIEGDYRQLVNINATFDYIVCSHVLEHVHQPSYLIELLSKVLSPNGILLLSFPNAISDVRYAYGLSWRGLESPRHISIASKDSLTDIFIKNNFKIIESKNIYGISSHHSNRIAKRQLEVKLLDRLFVNSKIRNLKSKVNGETDFLQLVISKSDHV